MGKGTFVRLITGLFLLTMVACSTKEYKPLTMDSSPSLKNSLLVMGIKWIENYNDPETKEDKTMVSYELLNDEKLIKRWQIEQDQPELYRPLYYLNNFKFNWSDSKSNDHEIVRFYKNMLQYENIALYEIEPGSYTLNGFLMSQLQLQEARKGKSEKRWQLVLKQYDEEIGSWELPAGKIVYLGDLTLYFRTEKVEQGVLTPEIVNKHIRLEKMDLKDNFDSMKAALKKQKPWFPADKMINISMENEWVYLQPEIKKQEPKEEKSETKKPDKKEAKPEKKPKNTFY